MIPDVLKWDFGRKTWVNVLCLVLALVWIALFFAVAAIWAFVSALISLALKS